MTRTYTYDPPTSGAYRAGETCTLVSRASTAEIRHHDSAAVGREDADGFVRYLVQFDDGVTLVVPACDLRAVRGAGRGDYEARPLLEAGVWAIVIAAAVLALYQLLQGLAS